MRSMFRHLLLLTVFFGGLSFTKTTPPSVYDYASTQNSICVQQDSLTPVSSKKPYSTPVAHPDVRNSKMNSSGMVNFTNKSSKYVTSKTVAICKGNGYFVGGRPRFVSGVFTDTLSTVTGKDSIVITKLTILDCQSSR